MTATSTRDFRLQIYFGSQRVVSTNVGFYVLAVRVLTLEKQNLIFFAGDDCTVRIASFTTDSKLNPLLTLTGHANWIKSIDVAIDGNNFLVLTASQDNHARLWSLKRVETIGNLFKLESRLETVLSGHEDSLTSARISQSKPRRILTSSLDRSVILWAEPTDEDAVWCESARVGEVGGNNPGFIGCTFDRSHEDIRFAAYSFNGALHFWQYDVEHSNQWLTQRTFGGHFERVTSISWEPEGNYLISSSADETTRIHLPFVDASSTENWLEFARPQIHGYEINCVCAIDAITFVSGADEKVIRVFQATRDFVDRFYQVTGNKLPCTVEKDKLSVNSVQPALGLTNRAIYGDETDQGDVVPVEKKVHTLPREEDLMQNTLFPEIAKLYGHGNEIFSLAVNHQRTILASSCKAAKQQEAGLILWSIGREFTMLQKLDGHQLTVTAIKFSPDDKFILSVSRDRTLFLYALKNDRYVVKANTDKNNGIHKRIIWDAAWTFDGQYFCTVSRDKTAIMWRIDVSSPPPASQTSTDDNLPSNDPTALPLVSRNDVIVDVKPVADQILTLEHSIGCCDILTNKVNQCYLIALGTEDGSLSLNSWNVTAAWSLLHTFTPHQASITRLAFKPREEKATSLTLASASEDKSVQIHRISLLN